MGILEKTIIIFGKNWFRSSPRLKIFSNPHLDKIRSALTVNIFKFTKIWASLLGIFFVIIGENDNDDEELDDIAEENESLDPESEDESEEDEEDFEDGMEEDETMTIGTNVDQDNYDEKHVNFQEEQDTYSKIKDARMDEMFPDEVDTPIDVAARIRFQKYRGLKSFRSSPWDPKENLPFDYARIFQFENFNRTKKNVLISNDNEGDDYKVTVGSYVRLVIKNVPSHLYSEWANNTSGSKPCPLIVFSMLKHENKMSVMNVVVKRARDPMHDDPIGKKHNFQY